MIASCRTQFLLTLVLVAVCAATAGCDAYPQEAPPLPPGGEETPPSPPTQTPPAEAPGGTGTQEVLPPVTPETAPPGAQPAVPRRSRPRRERTLAEKYADLVRKMTALEPRGIYLLIDTGTNRLYLMRGKCILRAAVCSTGSGRFLPDPPRSREWTFDTPKGEFRIQKKYVKPVWIKPDWAFIEEGEPLPKSLDERIAPEELGEYALDLGEGYLIHGTLYERALGLSVTHGCVRLGAKDLDAVFHAAKVGTRVYIY